MANSINSFVNNLSGGGARANQFQVNIVAAPFAAAVPSFSFLCRGAQIPALTVGEVAVPYRGRQVFLAGDRTYDGWNVTVFADANWAVRGSFEVWAKLIAETGNSAAGATNSNFYYGVATVTQLGRDDNPLAVYMLQDVWPQTVDAIDLAYDTNDAIMEFGVTLRFNSMIHTPV